MHHTPLPIDRVQYLPAAESPETGATVTILRDAHFYGAAMAPMLLVDGEEVAHISNGSSLTFTVDEGSHLIGMRSIGNDMLTPLTLGMHRPTEITELELNAEAGEQYYYRIEIRAGRDNATIQRTSF